MKSYLRLNRRLIVPNLCLAVGSLLFAGGACTTDDSPASGWTNAEYQIARDAFFGGYGTPDAFGECAFDWVVANYSPEALGDVKEGSLEADRIIRRAAAACSDQL